MALNFRPELRFFSRPGHQSRPTSLFHACQLKQTLRPPLGADRRENGTDRPFCPAITFLASGVAETQFTSVRVLVIDRGQADGILIRTPNSKWVTIDAGKDGLQAQSMTNPAIWGNIDSVSIAFISHRHSDHYGGLTAIMSNLPVGLLVMNMDDCRGRVTDDKIRDLADSLGIATQSVGAHTLFVDGVRFIVAPPDDTPDSCPSRENDNSIVVRMDYGDFSMLFTGDSETDERTWLMENHSEMLDVDILKASHHGSINGADGEANGQSWIQHVDPEAVVISAKTVTPMGIRMMGPWISTNLLLESIASTAQPAWERFGFTVGRVVISGSTSRRPSMGVVDSEGSLLFALQSPRFRAS